MYFSFKNFMDLNSLSFIRFDFFLYDPAAIFSYFENFLKFKMGDLTWGGGGGGGPILQKG